MKILAGAVAIQPSTAFGFIFCGAALFAVERGAQRAALLLGAVTALLGLVTTAEFLVGVDLQIDRMLLGNAADRVTVDLARMAPSTALCFVVVGAAVAIPLWGERTSMRSICIGSLGAIVFGIGAIACAGYLSGFSATYAWDRLNGMALPAAAGFLVVGAGLLGLAGRHAGRARRSSPIWPPLFVGIGGLTATLILWQAFLVSEDSNIHQLIRNQEINIHNRITSNINSMMFDLLRSAARWERFNFDSPKRIQDEARLLVQWLRGLRAIGWLDESNRMHWIVPEGSYSALAGADLNADRYNQAALKTARAEGMVLARARDATPGSDRYFIYAPISDKQKPRGFIIGIFQAQELFDQLIDDEAFVGYSIALYDGAQEIYRRRGSDSQYRSWTEESLMSLGNVTWRVKV